MDTQPQQPHDRLPAATPPAGRRRALELIDREIADALLLGAGDLPARPTKGFHRIACRETRPAGRCPERLLEHAEHGGDRERMKARLRAAAERAVDLAHDYVATLRRRQWSAA